MALLLTKVIWYGISTEGEQIEGELSDVESISIRQSIKPKSNYCEIKLKNAVAENLSNNEIKHNHVSRNRILLFNEGDTIKVYAVLLEENRTGGNTINTSATSSDLLMSASLEEIKIKGDDKSSVIILKCVDKTFALLNKLWSYAYLEKDGWTAPTIIQDVVRSVTDQSQEFYRYDDNGNLLINGKHAIDVRLKSVGGLVEDTRQDGSAFSTISIGKVFKPAYEFIQDLSTPESTNTQAEMSSGTPPQNRTMAFYIDELNRLHWFFPRDAVTTTLNGSINSSVTTITVTNAGDMPTDGRIMIEKELIDYTGKSGNDLTGCTRGVNNTGATSHTTGVEVTLGITIKEGDVSNGIEVQSIDMTKKTFDIVNMVIYNAGKDLHGTGILWYYYDTNTKDKDLKMTYKPYTDIAQNMIKEEIEENNIVVDSSGEFTFQETSYTNTAYGFTTSWGVDTTGFSDKDYNDSLRDYAAFNANSEGTKRASALCAKRGSPRWKGNITTSGYKFISGDTIIFTSVRFGIINQQLRLNEVTHNISKDSWTTIIQAEEDEDLLEG